MITENMQSHRIYIYDRPNVKNEELMEIFLRWLAVKTCLTIIH